jgi:hypothetical protein
MMMGFLTGRWLFCSTFAVYFLTGGLMLLDSPFSTTCLLALLIGVGLAGKLDNGVFRSWAIFSCALLIGISFFLKTVVLLIIPLLLFILVFYLDEVVDGLFDSPNLIKPFRIFGYLRPLNNILLLILIIAGLFPAWYLIPFILFDVAYVGVDQYGKSILANA